MSEELLLKEGCWVLPTYQPKSVSTASEQALVGKKGLATVGSDTADATVEWYHNFGHALFEHTPPPLKPSVHEESEILDAG